jgi:hypothetical protein
MIVTGINIQRCEVTAAREPGQRTRSSVHAYKTVIQYAIGFGFSERV